MSAKDVAAGPDDTGCCAGQRHAVYRERAGAPLSGLLLGWFDWRGVGSCSCSLLGIAMTFRFVPDPDAVSKSGRFDVVGRCGCRLPGGDPAADRSRPRGAVEPPVDIVRARGRRPVRVGALRTPAGTAARRRRLMQQRPLVVINVAGVLLGFAMFSNMHLTGAAADDRPRRLRLRGVGGARRPRAPARRWR